MYLGRKEVLLTLDVEFDDAATAEQVARTVVDIEREVRERFPVIRRIYIEARQLGKAGTGGGVAAAPAAEA